MERVAITIGADPEIFVADDAGVVPADLILPSQRKARWKNNEESAYTVYRDGMQAEIGVKPSESRGPICMAVQGALRDLNATAKEHGMKLVCEPCVPVTPESLAKAKDPMSTEFGCSPERIARFEGANNHMELDGRTHMIRYAGGHFHVGDKYLKAPIDEHPQSMALRHPLGRIESVRCLDIILGNQLVLIERAADRDRREAYGKAGTYRETPYGFEYRTPSNLVLRHPAVFNLAMGLVRLGVAVAVENARKELFNIPDEEVIQAIDFCDKEQARKNYLKIREALFGTGGAENDISRASLALLEYMSDVGTDEILSDDLLESWETPLSWTEFAQNYRSSSKEFRAFERVWKV